MEERSPETERRRSRGEIQCRQTDMTFFHCGLASRHRTEEGFVSWGAFPPPLFRSLSSFFFFSFAWLSLRKDMFNVEVVFTVQRQHCSDRRSTVCEVNKPKGRWSRVPTTHKKPITAQHTACTGNSCRGRTRFPLQALISASVGPTGPCWCCCHGNTVCMQERLPFVWNRHNRCWVGLFESLPAEDTGLSPDLRREYNLKPADRIYWQTRHIYHVCTDITPPLLNHTFL